MLSVTNGVVQKVFLVHPRLSEVPRGLKTNKAFVQHELEILLSRRKKTNVASSGNTPEVDVLSLSFFLSFLFFPALPRNIPASTVPLYTFTFLHIYIWTYICTSSCVHLYKFTTFYI